MRIWKCKTEVGENMKNRKITQKLQKNSKNVVSRRKSRI